MSVSPAACFLAALLLAGARVRAGEVVTTDFDLLGWHRLGLVSVEAPPLEVGSIENLLDGDRGTLVRTGVDPAVFALQFEPPQVVRRVSLQPGSVDGHAVTLTVVDDTGRRFAAGEAVVGDGNPATFRLLDVPAARLELSVERLERDDVVHVAGLGVTGRLVVDAISLENVPETLPQGGSLPLVVSGRDSHGGRPDLTLLAQLEVTPSRALELREPRRAVVRVGGPISIVPHLGELRGLARNVLVTPLEPAPPAPLARPGLAQVQLDLHGEPPLEVFRRRPGARSGEVLARVFGNRYFDDDVTPGSAWSYSARRIDRFGNALTPLSEETRVRSLPRPPEGHVSLGRLPVLVVLYVDSFADEAEQEGVRESIEFARLFLHRHSGARLHLDVTWLPLSGPTPPTQGPSMAAIERQLRGLGVQDDQFGVVFAIADDLDGTWGNFTLLGRTAGAFGRAATVPTPDGVLGPDPAAAWSFVHELLHVLQQRIAASTGRPPLATGHFDQDYAAGLLGRAAGRVLDVGEAWDGAAALLADTEWWAEVGPPYRLPFETIDSDGDGLADDDPRLPLDERRFGSDPRRADTDGDGLSDLAEAAAGLFGPSSPRHPDTDGDGLRDGSDRWPLSNFTGVIPRGERAVPLATGPEFGRPSIELAACWDDDALVLVVTTRTPCNVYLDLDGSGDLGRWESDVAVLAGELRGSDVWCGPSRIALRPHHAPLGVFVGERPVPDATVTASQRPDGRWALTARLPAALGPGAPDVLVPADAPVVSGLRLQPGTVLGLAVTVRPADPADPTPLLAHPTDRPWQGLFETHRLMDAVLVDA